MADGETSDVVVARDVCIIFPNMNVWTLQKVRHNNHSIVFLGGAWKVTKGVMVLARG